MLADFLSENPKFYFLSPIWLLSCGQDFEILSQPSVVNPAVTILDRPDQIRSGCVVQRHHRPYLAGMLLDVTRNSIGDKLGNLCCSSMVSEMDPNVVPCPRPQTLSDVAHTWIDLIPIDRRRKKKLRQSLVLMPVALR